jgi:hypothetical protein
VQYALELAKIDIQLDHPFFHTEEKLYEDLKVEASKSKEGEVEKEEKGEEE